MIYCVCSKTTGNRKQETGKREMFKTRKLENKGNVTSLVASS